MRGGGRACWAVVLPVILLEHSLSLSLSLSPVGSCLFRTAIATSLPTLLHLTVPYLTLPFRGT